MKVLNYHKYIILFVRPMDVHAKENQYFLNSVYN